MPSINSQHVQNLDVIMYFTMEHEELLACEISVWPISLPALSHTLQLLRQWWVIEFPLLALVHPLVQHKNE
jgi:hypothetical protein